MWSRFESEILMVDPLVILRVLAKALEDEPKYQPCLLILVGCWLFLNDLRMCSNDFCWLFSHNIYVEGHLFSCPWVCRGWLLEPSFSDPPVPPGRRYYCCCSCCCTHLNKRLHRECIFGNPKTKYMTLGPKFYTRLVSAVTQRVSKLWWHIADQSKALAVLFNLVLTILRGTF